MADGSFPSPAAGPAPAPHNLDAEQALLGAILFDNEVLNRLGALLAPSHFYDPVHGRLFSAMQKAFAVGKLADAVTLRDQFERDGGLSEIGGPAYFAELLTRAASTAAALDYAHIILDLAMRRELIRLGGEIAEVAADPGSEIDPERQIEQAEKKLYDLAVSGQIDKGWITFPKAAAQSIAMAEAAYKMEGRISGIPTGLTDLDRKLGGLHRSNLLILAGRPSMGKSALAMNIAFNAARRFRAERQENGKMKTVDGGVVGFFSLEMSAEQLATRLLADYSGIASDRLRRGDIKPAEFSRLREAAEELERLPLYLDETGGISLAALSARARRLARSPQGLDLLVVDYLQLVTASNRKSEGRVQEVSEITQGLKALAKDLNIPVIALSQLSRQVENRDDKRPQLSDLRESGSIEQDADVVMFVYRESYYLERQEPKPGTDEHFQWQTDMDRLAKRGEVIIGKQRHGPIGKIELAFEPELTRFSDLAPDGRYPDPR
jgi:replicative DNA helicase